MNPNNTSVAEKPQKIQAICSICGLNLEVFFEMFGVEATCCDLHDLECPVCSKELK